MSASALSPEDRETFLGFPSGLHGAGKATQEHPTGAMGTEGNIPVHYSVN